MRLLKRGWFFAMSLLAVVLSVWIASHWPPRLGLDLTGGVRLVYEVDREALAADGVETISPETIDWRALERALNHRIDPGATSEGRISRLPPWQVEIIVPTQEDLDLAKLRKLIGTAGVLSFRVVANPVDHPHVVERARQQAGDVQTRRSDYVQDGDKMIGYWARIGRESTPTVDGVQPLKVQAAGDVIRDAGTGVLIEPQFFPDFTRELALERYLADQGIEEIDVLMALDDGFDVTGAHLASVARTWDETGRPCVSFDMGRQGAVLMAGLTGSNLPDTNRQFYRRLGIMLDGVLLSAPRVMSTISDRGRITGDFSLDEVDFLVSVLRSGSLPVRLQRIAVSETHVDPAPQASRTVGMILCVALGLLTLLWLVMLWRHGLIGAGGSLSSLVQALLVLAAVSMLRVTITVPAVVAAVFTVVLAAVVNELICELVLRGKTLAPDTRRSQWRGLLTGAVMAALLCGVLLLSGIVIYALAPSAIRISALTLALGSLAILLTSSICLPALIAASIAEQSQLAGDSADQDIITASIGP